MTDRPQCYYRTDHREGSSTKERFERVTCDELLDACQNTTRREAFKHFTPLDN